MASSLRPALRDRLSRRMGGPSWRRIAVLRRSAAAVLAAMALALALLPRPGSAGVDLVVAAVDIAPGATIDAAAVVVRSWPSELAPAGALTDTAAAVGHVLVGAARAGEPITDARLVGAGPLSSAGVLGAAVPVRLADAGVASLLLPGSRVDVVTLGERNAEAVVLASDAVVLAVLAEDARARGRLVLVAMPRATAAKVAAAALTEQVAVTMRGPP
ncbi:SAF domain-containing protein [Pseudonocardia sp. TRM90224]|uniref:SAF domain-containing protein n=1 Tax=Pseudonocardia sp. TRM90224 TaxID=2812678 RepID=UPI001E472B82|nr:SAF domain-containing protein [Pseudonocardia sp. TRM90224]